MWKNKNTYRFVRTIATVSAAGVSTVVVGSLIFKKDKSERKKVMKERKLQVPEFMKKNMNVPVKVKENDKVLCHSGDMEPEVVGLTAEQVAEKFRNYYSYDHEIDEQCCSDEVREESKAKYIYNNRPQKVEELSEPHKEKLIRHIKGMSVAEQMLALESIPIEMCIARISKEIAELKDFKSTINGAMSALERKF